MASTNTHQVPASARCATPDILPQFLRHLLDSLLPTAMLVNFDFFATAAAILYRTVQIDLNQGQAHWSTSCLPYDETTVQTRVSKLRFLQRARCLRIGYLGGIHRPGRLIVCNGEDYNLPPDTFILQELRRIRKIRIEHIAVGLSCGSWIDLGWAFLDLLRRLPSRPSSPKYVASTVPYVFDYRYAIPPSQRLTELSIQIHRRQSIRFEMDVEYDPIARLLSLRFSLPMKHLANQCADLHLLPSLPTRLNDLQTGGDEGVAQIVIKGLSNLDVQLGRPLRCHDQPVHQPRDGTCAILHSVIIELGETPTKTATLPIWEAMGTREKQAAIAEWKERLGEAFSRELVVI